MHLKDLTCKLCLIFLIEYNKHKALETKNLWSS